MLRHARIACLRALPVILSLLLPACALWTPHTPRVGEASAPYAYSRSVTAVTWNFSTASTQRKALGSDLWPCTWSADDQLYCAWGDGGGFDGNDDQIGRVSLGFARISGTPELGNPSAYRGKNVWGQLPYAEVQASFGGKVDSLIAINDHLYATAGIWTTASSLDPVHQGERGPTPALLRSADHARSWGVAATSPALAEGAFLNFGRDNAAAIDPFAYLYSSDGHRVYVKRIRKDRLTAPDVSATDVEYLTRLARHGKVAMWSSDASQAVAIFSDPRCALTPVVVYDVPLKRFLLTVGHCASSQGDSSAAHVGLFEAAHPWGPWATIGYYDHWGDIHEPTGAEFLGLQIPSKWISADGRTFWAVFSGAGVYDSFNIVRATLRTRRRWWSWH